MKYIEVTLHVEVLDPWKDLLVDALGEGAYDSFVDTADGVNGYVPMNDFDEDWVKGVIGELGCGVEYSVAEMPDKNWNEEWEKGHKWVMVEGKRRVYVRAPFHEEQAADYEIVIEPKMSFGTAHHATTYMMIGLITDLDLRGKRVLDMGCGTAVLGILAAKCGADYVEGIDVDEWAYRNALENVERNGVEMNCRIGDAALLEDEQVGFDVVIANINRNILLNDMGRYVGAMRVGGVLLLSGFYTAEVAKLEEKAKGYGLHLKEQREREGWASMWLVKE